MSDEHHGRYQLKPMTLLLSLRMSAVGLSWDHPKQACTGGGGGVGVQIRTSEPPPSAAKLASQPGKRPAKRVKDTLKVVTSGNKLENKGNMKGQRGKRFNSLARGNALLSLQSKPTRDWHCTLPRGKCIQHQKRMNTPFLTSPPTPPALLEHAIQECPWVPLETA